jgi:glutamate-1-semialdehyde aminotransferase
MNPTMAPPLPDITESAALLERARGLIPGLTQTLAKGPAQHVRGVSPAYLQSGRGARVRDVDGNEYTDWSMAIGPLVLGYAHPAVDEAIRRQLADGITFSLMHPLEVEVAEMLRDFVPNAESVRFSKTGADVTSAAVRVARAFTGREKVVTCGYHGWHDWSIAVTDRTRGIPASTRDLSFTFEYNRIETLLESIDRDTACVILEPVVFAPPAPGFLEEVRDVCRRNGALLVFDEMWTGFRLALGGAQEKFGVVPDLATFSKAIANGMPLSALTGRRDVLAVLEKDVFFYTTFGGEALSLAAARACLRELADRSVPRVLAETGARIRDGYNRLARTLGVDAWTRCVGMDCRTLVVFDGPGDVPLLTRSLVQQELVRRGILWGGSHTVSFSHGERDVSSLLAAYAEILPIVDEARETGRLHEALLGPPAEPVFRKTSGFHTKPAR